MKTTAAARPAAALRGFLVVIAILAALSGALAFPVYALATLLAFWDAPLWAILGLCAALGLGELYLAVLVPEWLDRRDKREAGVEPARARP